MRDKTYVCLAVIILVISCLLTVDLEVKVEEYKNIRQDNITLREGYSNYVSAYYMDFTKEDSTCSDYFNKTSAEILCRLTCNEPSFCEQENNPNKCCYICMVKGYTLNSEYCNITKGDYLVLYN